MLKKSITYTTFNGDEITEDFYFNLTKAECMKMELGTVGGFTNKIFSLLGTKDISKEPNPETINQEAVPALVNMFEDIILASYGKKSLDGKNFIKSEEIKNEFKCSEAYSVLFMELINNPGSAEAFIKGVFPKIDNVPAIQEK